MGPKWAGRGLSVRRVEGYTGGHSGEWGIFRFEGEDYLYFSHPYNRTDLNERRVELPIVQRWVERCRGGKVLEIGNVLSHYFAVDHDIVDKYETGPGIIQGDVADFAVPHQYDLIVSISTLEHVGWHEWPWDPRKILRTFENLRRFLAPGGTIVFTVPVGQNPHLDHFLGTGGLPITRLRCLRRISEDNRWMEVPWAEASRAKYGRPYRYANAIVVGVVQEESLRRWTPPEYSGWGLTALWTPRKVPEVLRGWLPDLDKPGMLAGHLTDALRKLGKW